MIADRPPTSVPTPTGVAMAPWQRFAERIDAIPRDAEGARQVVPNFGTSVTAVLTETPAIAPDLVDQRSLRLVPNGGGGNCLFHALAGRMLTETEVAELRREVAEETCRNDHDAAANALLVAAALTQTPCTQYLAERLMAGRARVPGDVLAALRAVSGIYTGRAEIGHWCRRHDGAVLCLDASGTLELVTPTATEHLSRDDFVKRMHSGTATLFHRAAHWSRVVGFEPPMSRPG